MKRILCMGLCLLLVLGCVGCSEEAAPEQTTAATEPASVIYSLIAMGPEDALLEADELEDRLIQMGYGYDEMYIRLNRDGTGHLYLVGEDVDILHDGAAFWREETPEDRTAFTLEGNVLTIDLDGFLYVFEH